MSSKRNKAEDKFNTRRMIKTPVKYMTGKNWLDHSDACARVDQMLLEGATIEQLMKSGRNESAVKSHLSHLKSEHGLDIDNTDGIYRFRMADSHSKS